MLLSDSQTQEQGGIYRWLNGFPPESVRRLRQVNTSSSSATHVILAVAFGTFDKNIRELNRLITGLLVARLKAGRKGDAQMLSRINAIMEEVHIQVDRLTGVVHDRAAQCNRPPETAANIQS